MILVLDIGNSQTKWAVFANTQIEASGRFPTTSWKSAQDLEAVFADLNFKSVAVSSVVSWANASVRELFKTFFSVQPFFINSDIKLPFELNIKNPQTVGADRLANVAFAVQANLGENVLVLDVGTFLTLDCYEKENGFIGGLIFPGIEIVKNNFVEKSANLPHIEIKKPKQILGVDTESALQSGLYHGYVHFIEGVKKQLEQERDRAYQLLATGGGFLYVLKDEFPQAIIDKNLTLKGVEFLHRFQF